MKVFLRIFVILILGWAIMLAAFLGQVQQQQPAPHPSADAIVMLTGGEGRLMAAMQLLADGAAPRLFVSGAHEQVRVIELIRHTGLNVNKRAIQLGRAAHTTAENATEVATWVADNQVESIIVVTSNYHMPRAKLELSRNIAGVTMTPYPVHTTPQPSAKLLAIEFHKWLAVMVGLRDAGVWLQTIWSDDE